MRYIKDTITENDVFNFVFFYDSLDVQKRKIILQGEEFKDSLDFYFSMKKELGKNLDDFAKKKIAELIPSYKLVDEIELFPVTFPGSTVAKRLLSSVEKENSNYKVDSISLTDEDKSYLVRIINREELSRLFVFSSNNAIIKNFDVTLYPRGKRYHLNDNTKPLEFSNEFKIDKIILKLN